VEQPSALLLWDADYPWDIRVEKFCETLAADGISMHVLARNLRRQPLREQAGSLTIHRLPSLPAWTGKLNDAVSFPAFVNPLWFARALATARQVDARLLIVRDLPLAPLAIWVGRLIGRPVVLDMAESYPEMIRNVWLFGPRKIRNIILRNPRLASQVERYVIRRIDRILVVVEESRDRLIRLGADPARITIVSNTPDPTRFSPARVPSLPRSDGLRLTYIGLLGYSRGLEGAIRGAARYASTGKRMTLEIFGTGKAETRLRQVVLAERAEAQVRFHGWLDNRELPRAIAEADVCVVPHRDCPHWQSTIPNKLFDYMAAGKPVLVSDVRPMARIVGETEAGLVFRDNDAEDFSRCLSRLEDPALRQRLGQNGRRAVEARYHWEHDAGRLRQVIRGLLETSA
jgi:glycosyltransferase involved in cell wall biosynthesis